MKDSIIINNLIIIVTRENPNIYGSLALMVPLGT
jgi:hypothetical protein